MNQMRNDYIIYKRAYEDSSQNLMWSYMLEYFVKRYTELAKEKSRVETLDTQTQYSIRLYCYGAVGMTREWLLYDNITPARTIVEMMFASMPETMRKIFFCLVCDLYQRQHDGNLCQYPNRSCQSGRAGCSKERDCNSYRQLEEV